MLISTNFFQVFTKRHNNNKNKNKNKNKNNF